MEKSTTELTKEYIKEHPDIKNCLKKKLINYSSLARLISKDLKIEKKTSKEAILIAARRFYSEVKTEVNQEKKIKELLKNSELEIKNKMSVLIIEKGVNFEFLDEIQKKIRKDAGAFYILEGSHNFTIITQEKYAELITERTEKHLLKESKGMVLLNFNTAYEIEDIRGVLSYLTSLFAENGVNIVECISCWTDNIFVIASQDLNKAINFLRF